MKNSHHPTKPNPTETSMTSVARKPKPPLSGYNLYFKLERSRILNGTDHLGLCISHEALVAVASEHKAKHGKRAHRKTHGKISFKDLAGIVAKRWKKLDRFSRKILESHAKLEKEEFRHLNEAYKKTEEYQMERQAQLQDTLQERSTGMISDSVSLMFACPFQSTAGALLPQPIGHSSYSQEENAVPSPGAYPRVQVSSDQAWSDQWDPHDPVTYSNDAGVTTSDKGNDMLSMSNFQWDDAAVAQEESEASSQEQSDEVWDLEIMQDMIDFHSSAFPGSSISDLLDTDDLDQAYFFES